MKTTSRWRPRRALLVVGAVGIVLGVAGGAQAAGMITGEQIKNGTVTSADVRNSTITTTDIRPFGLTPADYDGDVRGPQGARGEQGVAGAPGFRVAEFATSALVGVSPGAVSSNSATCRPPTIAVGGGMYAPNGDTLQLLDSAPLGPLPADQPTWVARVKNPAKTAAAYVVWAICAEVR